MPGVRRRWTRRGDDAGMVTPRLVAGTAYNAGERHERPEVCSARPDAMCADQWQMTGQELVCPEVHPPARPVAEPRQLRVAHEAPIGSAQGSIGLPRHSPKKPKLRSRHSSTRSRRRFAQVARGGWNRRTGREELGATNDTPCRRCSERILCQVKGVYQWLKQGVHQSAICVLGRIGRAFVHTWTQGIRR